MNTNHKFLKKVVCLFFICILFLSNCVVSLAAKDEDQFYTNDDDALEELFSMTIKDVYGDVKDPVGWISNGLTFVVIREYLDNNDETRYKIYVNTPNLPQYLQNMAFKTIADGWEDKTFEPESKLIPEVGTNEDNVINKFGFNLPVNKYQGEYPRLYMSLSGILPVKWYQKIWRGLKALVGLSFVDAPDKDNYRTLNYYNHQYSGVDNDLIDFIQEYWLDYFVNAILSDESNYFRDAEDFRAQLITKDEIEDAENFAENHADELKEAHDQVDAYNKWYDDYYNFTGVYNNVTSFKAEVDAIQAKVDNETDATKKAQYEQQLLSKKSEWEDHVDEVVPQAPEISEASQNILMQEAQAQYTIERYKDFEKRWKYGQNKNSKKYTNDDYAFSYAQCLLDISEQDKEDNGGENDCNKLIDGQQISGSVVDIFVSSGLYRIGLEKDSKDKTADSTRKAGQFPPQSGVKVLKKITSSSGAKSFPPPSGTGANTAQSFAYVNGGYAVTYVTKSGSPSYVAYYDTNGNYKSKVRYDNISHGNGACSTPEGNYLVSGLLNGHDQTGYVFNTNGGNVSYQGSKHLPSSASAIAYDKDTGNYVVSTGHTMRVYDGSLSTRIISISRNKHGRYFQDVGAGGGYVFACHTCSADKHGNNYIDIYNEITGQYCGSILIDYGELESVDVVNGQVVALVHMKGSSTNYVHPTGIILNGVAGGSTEPLEYKEELSRAEAIKILTLLQSKCGPAYKEVMENIVACMINNAAHEGEEIELEEYIDPRVMPYDRDTLIPSGGGGIDADGDNIHIADPRVDIYKNENIIGGFVSGGRIHPEYLLRNTFIAKISISVCGFFTKLSVFLNQIVNFQILDNLGLSPTNMWKSASVTTVTVLIMVILIVNMVIYAFKFVRGKAGLKQVIGRFLLFMGILTLIMLLVLYPERTWNNYKNLFNKVNNIGEMTIVSTMDNVEELYGNGHDSSVTYYLTYFNLWTLYNTGYSLQDPQQVIDYDDPEAEEMVVPTIDGQDTSLWSVVLADSFNRKGKNTYNMSINSKNGLSVNPNAYRVVDHFLAPRLYTTGPVKEGSSGGDSALNMVNKVNENYNGDFQRLKFFTGVGCVVNSMNLCFIALVKAITFFWMWYMLYIFVFNIVLGALEARNGLKNVVIRTLSPIIAMAFIGAWAGLVIEISMLSEGFINCVINIVLLMLSFRFLAAWQNNYALSFPAPLKYLVLIVDKDNRSRFISQRRIDQSRYEDRFDEIDINTIIDQDGNYRGAANDKKAQRAYTRAIEQAQMDAKLKNGKRHNYENIEDERLRRKVEQLDRVNGVPAGLAGSAKFSMEAELKNRSVTPVGDDSNNNTNSDKTTQPIGKTSPVNSPQGNKSPTTSTNRTQPNQQQPSRHEFKKIDQKGGGKITNEKKIKK